MSKMGEKPSSSTRMICRLNTFNLATCDATQQCKIGYKSIEGGQKENYTVKKTDNAQSEALNNTEKKQLNDNFPLLNMAGEYNKNTKDDNEFKTTS